MLPFSESINANIKTRIFDANTENECLIWHRDADTRRIVVIESCDWYFQYDDQLPILMKPGDVIIIEKESWHRILRKGNDRLVIQIESL